MPDFWATGGDVLFYCSPPNITTRLIVDGERLEDPGDTNYPYHVAIAISPFEKLEATTPGGVQINPIDYTEVGMEVRRPHYHDVADLAAALDWGMQQEGRGYGWIGDFDQGLRDLTRGHVHLPDWFIRWANKLWPYCSVLAGKILTRAGITDVPLWPPPSPEDIKLPLRDCLVWKAGESLGEQ